MLKIQVIGNIGSAPEEKTTKSGRNYLSFSIAHDRGRDVPPTWVRVVWFGGIDHRLRPYLRSGAKLCITGDAVVEAYQDRMNQPAASLTVYPDSVEVVLFPKREEGAEQAAPAQQRRAPVQAQQPAQARPQGSEYWGPGNPDYDRSPDFLKDQGDDLP